MENTYSTYTLSSPIDTMLKAATQDIVDPFFNTIIKDNNLLGATSFNLEEILPDTYFSSSITEPQSLTKLSEENENKLNLLSKDPLSGLAENDVLVGINLEKFQDLAEEFDVIQELKDLETLENIRLFAPKDLQESLDSFGLGKDNSDYLFGSYPQQGNGGYESGLGNYDPLNGHRQGQPKGTVIGPGGFPDSNSLVGQDGSGITRQRSWGSEDGRTTWTHTTYDHGGRSITRTDTREDGAIIDTRMSWDAEGNPTSSSRHEYDSTGHKSDMTIYHIDGSQSRTWAVFDAEGTLVKMTTKTEDSITTTDSNGLSYEVPLETQPGKETEAGKGKTNIAGYQPAEETSGGSGYNPFTGQYWGNKPKLSNDQVNPGDPDAQSAPMTGSSLTIDPNILVVNPDQQNLSGGSSFDPNRFESRNQVNPGPKPPEL